MIKRFLINDRLYATVSHVSDENCYRLVYLPSSYTDVNDIRAITLIDDTACEDYYGDIDTVTKIMIDQIYNEATQPHPWWVLLGAVFQWGPELTLIKEEETARNAAHSINNATRIYDIDMNNKEESTIAKERLLLEDFDVIAIHSFVNYVHGFFCLADEWFEKA